MQAILYYYNYNSEDLNLGWEWMDCLQIRQTEPNCPRPKNNTGKLHMKSWVKSQIEDGRKIASPGLMDGIGLGCGYVGMGTSN
jgi:hypothetical protein